MGERLNYTLKKGRRRVSVGKSGAKRQHQSTVLPRALTSQPEVSQGNNDDAGVGRVDKLPGISKGSDLNRVLGLLAPTDLSLRKGLTRKSQ